jgi:hypothetical protein
MGMIVNTMTEYLFQEGVVKVQPPTPEFFKLEGARWGLLVGGFVWWGI